MEFINSEEFLKQSKEVQEVFLDWWKPNIGDLVTIKYEAFHYLTMVEYYEYQGENIVSTIDKRDENKMNLLPLFTEGQLRKFIEDKGFKILEIFRSKYTYKWCIKILKNDEFDIRNSNTCDNLLQAYWKVACEIAKESI